MKQISKMCMIFDDILGFLACFSQGFSNPNLYNSYLNYVNQDLVEPRERLLKLCCLLLTLSA